MGADDRPSVPVRAGRPRADRGAQGVGGRGGRRPRDKDRPRGGLPPDARRDVARAPPRRAAVPRGARAAVAVRARRAPGAVARGARGEGAGTYSRRRLGRDGARLPHGRARGAVGRDDERPPDGAGGAMVTVDEVWAALDEVPDPEIPVISLVELGVVRRVAVEGDAVKIEFTPT